IHKANKGVLFIDEIASLKPHSQQELLTAMQEKKYSITGQSEMSSGAIVKTEEVPCDFVLVAAGNVHDMARMHPALRSRIRGNGYEVYVEDSMPDTEENREKIVQFIAQEVRKDGKIPHFSYDAVMEIIDEARRKAGRKNRLTLNLRELGGLVRVAGDVARDEGKNLVERDIVLRAKPIAQTLEHQISTRSVEYRKDYSMYSISGWEVGKVNGLAVLGDGSSGLVMPIVAEVTPASSKSEGKLIVTGKLGTIAKEAVENVSAIIKKHIGKDVSQYDIHVQFIQTYEGVEGDSASVSIALAVISAMEGIPVDQSYALTGSLTVRGEVLPIGGITAKTEAAIGAGISHVIVPKTNVDDIYLAPDMKGKIGIVSVSNIVEILKHCLKPGPNKDRLISSFSISELGKQKHGGERPSQALAPAARAKKPKQAHAGKAKAKARGKKSGK
ncbi:MAG TPA: ATP-dependent protease LonB, partial [Candidatus Micrarchaeota archaeon]|nr:ATP-dependent protease LonB [Candidatus Micrarchaeota archaeon]